MATSSERVIIIMTKKRIEYLVDEHDDIMIEVGNHGFTIFTHYDDVAVYDQRSNKMAHYSSVDEMMNKMIVHGKTLGEQIADVKEIMFS